MNFETIPKTNNELYNLLTGHSQEAICKPSAGGLYYNPLKTVVNTHECTFSYTIVVE